MKKFLFPTRWTEGNFSFFLLVLRVLFGVLFLTHGLAKVSHFDALAQNFPDPLSIGHTLSLSLAVFAEVVCSVALILGFLHRLALIPMIFTMIVAYFVVHGNDAFATKELAFIYLSVFTMLFLVGAGRYSLDYFIGKK